MIARQGHEPNAVDARRLHRILAMLVAAMVLVVTGMYWLSIATFDHGGYRHVVDDRRPSPRLQVHPREDLAALRARQDAPLRGYAWVDRDGGIARIPIDRAMALLGQQRKGNKQGATK